MSGGTYILMGRSGSGKGTQAELLKHYLEEKDPATKVLSVQTGQAFRTFAKRDTYTSALVRKVLGGGMLLPEFLPIWAWTDFLIENFTGTEHLIFDGITRKPDEVPVLDSALSFYGRAEADVVLINVSEEWATKRLLNRGRSDDIEKDIARRLAWFSGDVVPALERYKENPRYCLHEINGEQAIDEVHNEIIAKLF